MKRNGSTSKEIIVYSSEHEQHGAKPTGLTKDKNEYEWDAEYYCEQCHIWYWIRKEINTLIW